MRKILSIFLLLVILFNMIGFRVWFYYAEKASDAAMEARLDNNQYMESELVSLCIPLNNPYQVEQGSFERVSGEINYQGSNFRFVKRKITNGNLVLLCIPNTQKMVLKKAKTEFGNASNGIAGNGKSSSRSSIQKNFSGGDYICQCADVQLSNCTNASITHCAFKSVRFSDPHVTSPGKPPKSLA